MTYQQRKAAGLCVSCGHEKAMAGYVNCEKCNTKYNEHQRAVREARKQKGLCTICGEPNETEFVACFKCRKFAAMTVGQTKAERRRNGMCGQCGAPYTGIFSRCNKCRLKENEYMRKRRLEKKCQAETGKD